MKIETLRLLLVDFAPSDYAALLEVVKETAKSDTLDLLKYWPSSSELSEESWICNFDMFKYPFEESVQKFMTGAERRKCENPRKSFWFAVKEKKSGKLIGITLISAKVITRDGVNSDLIGHSGQLISPDYQRQGYASEAKSAMIDFLYTLKDKTIINFPDDALFLSSYNEGNYKSKNLQKKSGNQSKCLLLANRKVEIYTAKKDLYDSALMKMKPNIWKATFDDGTVVFSSNSAAIAGILNSFIIKIKNP
ncbi:MAG: GNAT family N-acetyltransferase [Alphaproteobacteria bacterium]|nr:GNAT family N-acetyltransferase [Alphaproteobacteria bacterium]MCL2889842.1 GNAT family N-acetyltransferase [Alphaproteobacteria bacterium]